MQIVQMNVKLVVFYMPLPIVKKSVNLIIIVLNRVFVFYIKSSILIIEKQMIQMEFGD
jgi:hypothetical protein